MAVDLIKEAESFFNNNFPSSRPSESYKTHIILVRKYALMLAEEYDADKLVLEVSALLHDVGADEGENHASKSAEIVKEFLEGLNINSEIIDRIISAIENHSYAIEGREFKENIFLFMTALHAVTALCGIGGLRESLFPEG